MTYTNKEHLAMLRRLSDLDAGPAPQGGSRRDGPLMGYAAKDDRVMHHKDGDPRNNDPVNLELRHPTPPQQYDIPALIAQNADALQALSLELERVQSLMDQALVTWTNIRDRLGQERLLADVLAVGGDGAAESPR